MPNAITNGISKNLPKDLDKAVDLIAHLAGLDPNEVAKWDEQEILVLLSFLLKCEKDKVRNLLREHDVNALLSDVTLMKEWKLVEKGVLKRNKRSHGSMTEKAFENLKFMLEGITQKIRFNAENNLSTATSLLDPYATGKKPKVSLGATIMAKFQMTPHKSQANDNTTSISSGIVAK